MVSPFSFIAHCLHKIVRVEAEGIMIVPFRPTQPYTQSCYSESRCAKDTSTGTDHAKNARERARVSSIIKVAEHSFSPRFC